MTEEKLVRKAVEFCSSELKNAKNLDELVGKLVMLKLTILEARISYIKK